MATTDVLVSYLEWLEDIVESYTGKPPFELYQAAPRLFEISDDLFIEMAAARENWTEYTETPKTCQVPECIRDVRYFYKSADTIYLYSCCECINNSRAVETLSEKLHQNQLVVNIADYSSGWQERISAFGCEYRDRTKKKAPVALTASQ